MDQGLLERRGEVEEGPDIEALEGREDGTGDDVSTKDVADLVAIPARTLQRRKVQGRLDPDESDRLLRVARVFAMALELFEGDARAAHDWFQTPARALGGEEPIRLAATDLGAREVEALIERLEHGVLA